MYEHDFDDTPSTIQTLEELYQQPKTEWLIPGVLPEKALVGIHGAPATGKSLYALHLACGLATEHSVLYVAGHGHTSCGERIQAWQEVHGISPQYLYPRTCPVDLTSYVHVGSFIREAAIYQPDLLVIDSLSDGILGMNENSPKDMSVVMRHLLRIRADLNTTLIFVHYPDQRGRVNSIIHRTCDVMFEVQKVDRMLTVSPCKVRDHINLSVHRLELVQTSTGVALQ